MAVCGKAGGHGTPYGLTGSYLYVRALGLYSEQRRGCQDGLARVFLRGGGAQCKDVSGMGSRLGCSGLGYSVALAGGEQQWRWSRLMTHRQRGALQRVHRADVHEARCRARHEDEARRWVLHCRKTEGRVMLAQHGNGGRQCGSANVMGRERGGRLVLP